jgi:predicted transcriptional regulator of viral defense system
MSRKTQKERVIGIVEKLGILRPRDLKAHGIPREILLRLLKEGMLDRIDRGLYTLPNRDRLTEYHSFAQASRRIPTGVICLLSALAYHELTTQMPHEIWMAIGEKAWASRQSSLPIRYARFSARSLTEGVITARIEGVEVKLFNPAKTVADCFKYRNKIGLDVAIEALRECHRQRRCNFDHLWHYAKICRVSNVMRPYLAFLQ